MTRLPDWQARLTDYLRVVARRGFAYGRHDCCTFTAGCVAAMTGVDPMRGFRGYRTLAGAMRNLQAKVELGANQGAEHRIDSLGVRLERAAVQGHARIATATPLTLAVELQAAAREGKAWRANLQAQGPLAGFEAQVQLRGEATPNAPAPRLDAKGRVEPFAAWPIAALELSTAELDLSAIAAGAPQTRLRGNAQVQSAGLDRPAHIAMQLDNALPGRWDQQRLPIRQLQLALGGTPRQLDRLEIERFDAQLADERGSAGRVQGRGRWEGALLQLQLRAQSVRPERLDARAGVFDISGPLSLDLSGVPVPTQRDAKASPWRAQARADLAGTVGPGRVTMKLDFAGGNGHNLEAGDVGTVVLVHGKGAAYEVEFMTLGGDTVAVLTIDAADVRPFDEREIVHARAGGVWGTTKTTGG